MAKLSFKSDECKGCGLCVSACPKKVLALARDKINKKGHHPVEAASGVRGRKRLTTRSIS